LHAIRLRGGPDDRTPYRTEDASMISPTPAAAPVPFSEATVADAMSHGVIHCAPETPMRSVARLMATYGVHAVYVFDYGSEDDVSMELWGLVSDLDVAAAAAGVLDRVTARERAVAPLYTVASDEPLSVAAELMALKSTSHLAVLDPRTLRPTGVVSTLDVARAIAAETGIREIHPSA
jgi:CBS domain-containing protein